MSSSNLETVSNLAGERRLHRFAALTAFSTWILIWAGGLVTSTESGLAVPDWPLSYGMLMPPMVGGILYEHGHRMVATFVGLLTLILAVWIWLGEPRRWLRWVGLASLAMVITQGVLGGITVLYLLPTAVSVSHATLAQTFFCITVLMAFATSREWKSAAAASRGERFNLRAAALITTAAIYLQLILGALVRHTGSALAIPDFPLAFGSLLPPLEDANIAIHFVHRVGALLVTGCTAWLAIRIWHDFREDRRFLGPALILCGLIVLQIAFGATLVWTSRSVFPATAHVATGALALATGWFITLRAFLHLDPPKKP